MRGGRVLNPAFAKGKGGQGIDVGGGKDAVKRAMVRSLETGALSLAGRGLAAWPPDLSALDQIDYDGKQWWTQQELVKLDLSHNELCELPQDIDTLPMLQGLQTVTLLENRLQLLPDRLFMLPGLTKLHAARNRISELPETLGEAMGLQELDLAGNVLGGLPPGIGNLHRLTVLNLGGNALRELPESLSGCASLRTLRLEGNQLSSFPAAAAATLSALTELDLSCNKLEGLPAFRAPGLIRLDAHQNRLRQVPLLGGMPKLQELLLGFNALSELPSDFAATEPEGLCVVDVRDNKITQLEPLCGLRALKRLDVANNNVAHLPPELGTLPALSVLSLEGNPLKSVRRDVLMRGTAEVLKYLRSRLAEEAPSEAAVQKEAQQMGTMSRGCTDISRKQGGPVLQHLPPAVLEDDGLQVLRVNGHQLTELPDEIAALRRLHTLEVCQNRLRALPSTITALGSLHTVVLRRNEFTDVPEPLLLLRALRSLDLSQNRIATLPRAIAGLPALHTLCLADNSIGELPAELWTLDLSNNSLAGFPPEVGRMTHLRSLLLHGNPLKSIRRPVLDKGTEAVLAYLRDRIPQ
eukprot:TRINITY_DN25872_c0_g1_i3.p1 TRINITY_DN25872_c0_g1~~TRINITY_DN25872_c0_g1_i3.p1  ORF type:complete len:607 (+),score=143.96 TRINITY_DN25872_c0_g1_i3:84-1823(+)